MPARPRASRPTRPTKSLRSTRPARISGRAGVADDRLTILGAMRAELKRSMSQLKLGHHRRPYFISYLLRRRAERAVTAKAGAIVEDDAIAACSPYVDVRVGSYRSDNTDPAEGPFDYFDAEGWNFGPIEANGTALRQMFWLLTDRAYKRAAQEFLEKRGRGATRPTIGQRIDDFTREPRASHIGPRREDDFVIDRDLWRERLRDASLLFRRKPWIEDAIVSLRAHHTRQYFVNSEGSEHIQDFGGFSLSVYAAATAPRDGSPVEFGFTHNFGRREELPDSDALVAACEQVVRELGELRDAPVLSPYSGPAMLGPDVTGVIFHEAVGHRLEGERMRLRDEGHTFKGKVGRRIVPAFIDLYDDPTLAEFNGQSITGHYSYDEEGVEARRVDLVTRGVLREYLLSRVPVWGFRHSNGHGRSDGHSRAQARMGVFVIRTNKEHSREELKEILLDECRRQKKPYGLIIEKIDNGLTNTTTHEFQAFAEVPTRVVRVNAKTGEEMRVRGVEIVGTPLATINKIVAMGGDYQVFNGYCGAESGMIPQSEIAPSCVVSEIELQRASTETKRPPILPPPK